MADKKVHIEYCTSWEFRGAYLYGVFNCSDSMQHAIGAAMHLGNTGVLQSGTTRDARRVNPYQYIEQNSGVYEIVLRDRDDQKALARMLAAKYHGAYEMLMQGAGETFGAMDIYTRTSMSETQWQAKEAEKKNTSDRRKR